MPLRKYSEVVPCLGVDGRGGEVEEGSGDLFFHLHGTAISVFALGKRGGESGAGIHLLLFYQTSHNHSTLYTKNQTIFL